MKKTKEPSKHKIALLTWIVIYPLITVIFLLFNEQLMELPLAIRTLILTVVLVGLMNYIIMPNLRKKLNNWLTNEKRAVANNGNRCTSP